MANLIRSEWFKLKRSRVFWLMLGVLLVSAVAYCVLNYMDDPNDGGALNAVSGMDMFVAGMGGNFYIIKIGVCILAGFFISSEYSTGTMKRAVTSGNTRSQVILAKTSVYLAGSVLTALLFPLASLAAGSLLFGIGTLEGVSSVAEYIVRCLGLTITVAAAHAAIAALIGTLLNDSGKTIGFGVIFFFFIDGVFALVGNYVPIVKTVYEYSVFSQIIHYTEPALSSRNVLLTALIPLATSAALLVLCVLAFRKKEIK